ncbi:MAG: OmpA family protein [Proteobacteria bacterium]|nr:OmpA family protein [Pseudomonadota bacterium]
MSHSVKTSRARLKKPNHERWVISYADLMTLLLAFFVVLFASSTRNKVKMDQEARSLVKAFHGQRPAVIHLQGANSGILQHQPSPVPKPVERPAPHTPHLPVVGARTATVTPVAKPARHSEAAIPHPAPPAPSTPPAPPARPAQSVPVLLPPPPLTPLSYALSQRLAEEAMELARVRKELEALLQPLTSAHEVTIEATPLTLTISLNAEVLFDTGRAALLPAAGRLLGSVAHSLRTLPEPFSIQLDGYTDDQPIATAQFPSNWSLSVERAVSVVQLFADQGIDGKRLSAEGFAEYAPVAPNDTNDGRAKNRRVVIVIRAPDVKTP